MSENQSILKAKSVALRKRHFVWFISNLITFELFCILWFPVNNFNSLRYLDLTQHFMSWGLFAISSFYVAQAFQTTKGNCGSTSLRIRPFAKGFLVVTAKLVFSGLIGRLIYIIITSTTESGSLSVVQIFSSPNLKTDLIPVLTTFVALLSIQQSRLVLSDSDATSFYQSYLQCLKSHVVTSLKNAVVIGGITTAVVVALKLFLSVYHTYACAASDSVPSFVCPNVNFAIQSLLPQGGVWSVFYLSVATVFLVQVLIAVLHESLCLVEYFPVDFTKLVSSVSAKRVASIVSEGEDRRDYVDEKPLLTSLSKGLVLPTYTPLYPWLAHQTLSTTIGSTGLTTSIGTSSSHRTASSIPRDRQGHPLYTPQDPNWRIALKIQQHNADLLVQTADYNVLDPPCLPFWGEVPNRLQTPLAVGTVRGPVTPPAAGVDPDANELSSNDLLFRSFALQDLRRVASSSFLRRQMIFKKHWAEVAFTLTSLIDAAALQLHFVDTYMNEGAPVDASLTSLSTHYDEVAEAQSQAMDVDHSLGSRAHAALESLTTTTDSSGVKRSFSATAELTQFGANITDLANRAQKGHLGGSATSSAVSTQFATLTSTTFYLQCMRSLREVIGLSLKDRSSALHLNMFPPVMAQSVVNGVDSISLLLVAALSEDSSGLAQHHVPSVVNSLLMLEHALNAYSNTVHQTYLSHFSKLGRVHRIQYRVRSITHLSRSMQLLSIATDEALSRLVGAYRDVLTSCSFVDPLHAKAFRARLDMRDSSPKTVTETN